MNTDNHAQRIMVIGLGGGGSNTVNYMHTSSVFGVDLCCANTDISHLNNRLNVPLRLQLGKELVKGQGVGGRMELGEQAARESLPELSELLEGVDMLFVTAGMGGGTGTGSASVIAELAREKGILTVGVVTTPFNFEGKHRMNVAKDGIKRLRPHVDSLIIIPNQRLFELDKSLPVKLAYEQINMILYRAVLGISDVITQPADINVDFNDIKVVMSKGGYSLIGQSEAFSLDKARESVEQALSNPFLADTPLNDAKALLITIQHGEDFLISHFETITDAIFDITNSESTEVYYGQTLKPELQGQVMVNILLTGMEDEIKLDAKTKLEGAKIQPRTSEIAPKKVAVPRSFQSVDVVADLDDFSEVELPIPTFYRRQSD